MNAFAINHISNVLSQLRVLFLVKQFEDVDLDQSMINIVVQKRSRFVRTLTIGAKKPVENMANLKNGKHV